METRLVAILLTDIAGYTEYSTKADRSGILAAVRQQQEFILPRIQAFRGRLVKWIGDAALVVFSSATDAILCARQIQLAFIESADRGSTFINPNVKAVVHVGEVSIDKDGDIYGDAVNVTARMEKAAQPDEVYFSETARRVISRAEIPHEPFGDFEFKGIQGKVSVYRTCFGQTPVVRKRTALVQTNFVGVQELADRYGWDVAHPALDEVTGIIVDATRRQGGTNRGVMQNGCFLAFPGIRPAMLAAQHWTRALAGLTARGVAKGELKVRAAAHWGTLHVMRYTTMGRDIDVVRTLAALGSGDDVLLTGEARQAALAEGLPEGPIRPVEAAELRECTSLSRWKNKFRDTAVFRLRLTDLEFETAPTAPSP